MTAQYYLKNFIIGLIIFSAVIYKWHDNPQEKILQYLAIYALLSCILFPFAKFYTELLASKMTDKEFWHKGLLKNDIGKNGLHAIYWLFCFVFALPIIIVVYFLIFNKAR